MFVKQVRSDSGAEHYISVSQITQIKLFKGKYTAVLLSGNTVELDAQDAARLIQSPAAQTASR